MKIKDGLLSSVTITKRMKLSPDRGELYFVALEDLPESQLSFARDKCRSIFEVVGELVVSSLSNDLEIGERGDFFKMLVKHLNEKDSSISYIMRYLGNFWIVGVEDGDREAITIVTKDTAQKLVESYLNEPTDISEIFNRWKIDGSQNE